MRPRYYLYMFISVSDHPLQHMIREHLGNNNTRQFCVGMFEAAISECLMFSRRFACLCVGMGHKPLLPKGIASFLGGNASDRYLGYITTGVGPVELREGQHDQVELKVKEAAGKVALLGAEAIILGCAGFSGMEETVHRGVREAGCKEVRLVDGTKAGLKILAGMFACRPN